MTMELSFFPIVFLSSLLVLFTTLLIKKIFHTPTNLNPPPGPPTLPIIGNLHQLIGLIPHRRIADLSKTYGPILQLQLGQVTAVVVTSPPLAKAILKDNDINFSQRTRLPVTDIVFYNDSSISFSPYGDYWRQMRKLAMMELLSAKRVQSFNLIRGEEVSNSIKYINSRIGSAVNVSEVISSLVNSISARLILGWKIENNQPLLEVIHQIMQRLGGFTLVDLFPSLGFIHVITRQKSNLLKLHEKVDRLLEDMIRNHKAKSGDESEPHSLLDVLLELQENKDNNLTNDAVKAIILEMFSGGIDSTSTIIEWTISEIMRSPRVLKKAQEEVRKLYGEHGKIDETVVHELKFLKAAIKEAMRLHPPGTLMPRQCREECKINGYTIKANTDIFINSWAIGRDPNHWTEPEVFYPERFIGSDIDYKGLNFELIPFGAGRRMCPGYLFGVTNIETFLAQLLNYFDWKLPGEMKAEDLDMTEAFGLAVRRKNDLYMIPSASHFHG